MSDLLGADAPVLVLPRAYLKSIIDVNLCKFLPTTVGLPTTRQERELQGPR